jgi:hypothetical protein
MFPSKLTAVEVVLWTRPTGPTECTKRPPPSSSLVSALDDEDGWTSSLQDIGESLGVNTLQPKVVCIDPNRVRFSQESVKHFADSFNLEAYEKSYITVVHMGVDDWVSLDNMRLMRAQAAHPTMDRLLVNLVHAHTPLPNALQAGKYQFFAAILHITGCLVFKFVPKTYQGAVYGRCGIQNDYPLNGKSDIPGMQSRKSKYAFFSEEDGYLEECSLDDYGTNYPKSDWEASINCLESAESIVLMPYLNTVPAIANREMQQLLRNSELRRSMFEVKMVKFCSGMQFRCAADVFDEETCRRRDKHCCEMEWSIRDAVEERCEDAAWRQKQKV